MAGQVLLAFSTFPDVETARKIVREIVNARLAACGNIVPKIESIYRWRGKLESGSEALAFFKIRADCYPEFQKKLRALHPYEVPEIISCKIDSGLPEYLRWVAESCAI
jgi:periplasmic divalent cation tolerance protein